MKASDEGPSRPVDLDQVAARLLETSADDTSTQPASRPSNYDRPRTRSPEPPTVLETQCYEDLVSDGGRPAYPISLMEQVSKNPEDYCQLLRPWQKNDPDVGAPDWMVIRRQWARWQEFRKWQHDNRGIDDDPGFPAFVEASNRCYTRQGTTWQATWPGRTEQQHTEALRRRWESEQRLRERGRKNLGEDCHDGGFSEHVEAVKHDLAEHGFTQTFQLDKDPKRQDKLTTWIEYLSYEYAWYDQYTRRSNRLKPKYEKAWTSLVNSGVLKPSETEEYLRRIELSFRLSREEDAAEKAVQSARSALRAVSESAQNEPQSSTSTQSVRLQRTENASSQLNAAEEALGAIRRRIELISDFNAGASAYKDAQWNMKRQMLRLQWILDEVPRIEDELNEYKAAEGSSNAERGTKRQLGRNEDGKVVTGRTHTKRKQNDQGLHSDERAGSTRQAKGKSKRSTGNDTVDDKQRSKRIRLDSQDSEFERQGGGDVDAALDNSNTAESTSGGWNRRKRSFERGRDELAEDPNFKRQKQNASDECSHDSDGTNEDETHSERLKNSGHSQIETANELEAATIGQREKSMRNALRSSTTSQPLRRSARIAGRGEALQTGTTPSSHRRIAQAPAPQLRTRSQDQQSRLPATKTRKQGARRGRPSKVKGI